MVGISCCWAVKSDSPGDQRWWVPSPPPTAAGKPCPVTSLSRLGGSRGRGDGPVRSAPHRTGPNRRRSLIETSLVVVCAPLSNRGRLALVQVALLSGRGALCRNTRRSVSSRLQTSCPAYRWPPAAAGLGPQVTPPPTQYLCGGGVTPVPAAAGRHPLPCQPLQPHVPGGFCRLSRNIGNRSTVTRVLGT